jgi:hypothetical protein
LPPWSAFSPLGASNAASAINATLYEKLNFNFVRDIVLVGVSPEMTSS